MIPYVEAAFHSEIQALRTTSSGRACATFKAAAAIGGFVGAGEVDKSAAERSLLSAALETGLPEREAMGTSAAGSSADRRHREMFHPPCSTETSKTWNTIARGRPLHLEPKSRKNPPVHPKTRSRICGTHPCR